MKHREGNTLFVMLLVLSIISLLVYGGVRIYEWISFDINCGDRLARAAHANTISIARDELTVAVNYAKEHGMTTGYTSLCYYTPDEDVEFWYKNLTAALEKLKSFEGKEISPLEQSNVLLKLRESLRTNGKDGSATIAPPGITIYPHNAFYAWWAWISGIILGVSAIVLKVNE